MERLHRRLGIAAIAVLLTALLILGAAQTSSTATPRTVKIGVLAGLTGPSNIIGVPYVNGARMAAEEINAKGGLRGTRFQLVIEDTQTEAVPAVQAALKLVEVDKVPTMLCSCYTLMILPMAQALKNKNVVVTSNAATSPVVRGLSDRIISTIPTDDVLGEEMAKFAYGLGWHRAAVVSGNDTYGLSFRKAITASYKKLGGDIAIDLVVDLGQPDYGPEMKRIADAGKNIMVLLGTYTDDARLQFRQLRQLGWNGVAFNLYPTAQAAFTQDREAYGHFFGVDNITADDPKTKAWAARYKKRFGREPSIWAAIGYDALNLNALALANTPNPSVSSIKAAIRTQARAYLGPTGRIEFDKTMIRTRPTLAFYSLVGGKFVRVNAKGKIIK